MNVGMLGYIYWENIDYMKLGIIGYWKLACLGMNNMELVNLAIIG